MDGRQPFYQARAIFYPSIVQGDDARLQITYSYRRLSIKHVELNKAWVWEGQS